MYANWFTKCCISFLEFEQTIVFYWYHVAFWVAVGTGTGLATEQASSVSTLHSSVFRQCDSVSVQLLFLLKLIRKA